MKYQKIAVNMLFDASGHPVRFFFGNGDGHRLYECSLSDEKAVEDFLRETMNHEA